MNKYMYLSNQFQSYFARSILIALIAMLFSCGGGSSNPSPQTDSADNDSGLAAAVDNDGDSENEEIPPDAVGSSFPSNVGFIYFDQWTAGRTRGFGHFGLLSEGIARLNLSYLENDVCYVDGDVRPHVDVLGVEIAGAFKEFELIDAGSPNSIKSSGNFVGTLTRGSRDNSYLAFIDRPFPANATLSIQGSNFPAASDLEIPSRPPIFDKDLYLLTPTGDQEPVTIDTIFTWIAAEGSENSRLVLSLSSEGNYPEIDIECFVQNDGEFSFSENMKLGFSRLETPFSILAAGVNYRFESHVVHQLEEGDGVVVVSHSNSAESEL